MSENPPPQDEPGNGTPHARSFDASELNMAPIDPWLVERLVADPGASRNEEEQALATLFAALRAPAGANELVSQDQVLIAFDTNVRAQALRTTAHQPRRKSMLSTLLAVKTSVAAAALATVTVGTVAAAATGTLPASLQGIAHRVAGAPAPDRGAPAGQSTPNHSTRPPSGAPSTRPTHSGVGPDVTGDAVKGLCTAYIHGGLATTSTAYRNLATAAGGDARIDSFCTAIGGSSSRNPTGRPSTGRTPGSTVTPPGQPTDHATGKPTTHPTGPPSGVPTPTH